MNVARATHASSHSSTDGTADVLGLLSLGAGAALLVAPEPMTELFALPRGETMGRALGLRDLTVGVLLLVPATRELGLHLRALSDATDALLAGSESVRGARPLRSTLLTLAGGLGLSALTEGLATTRGGTPAGSRAARV